MEIPGGMETSSVFLKCCQSQEGYSGQGSCFDNILLQWLLSDVYLHVNTNHTANEDNDKSVQVQSSKVCSTIRKFCGLLNRLTGKCFSVAYIRKGHFFHFRTNQIQKCGDKRKSQVIFLALRSQNIIAFQCKVSLKSNARQLFRFIRKLLELV